MKTIIMTDSTCDIDSWEYSNLDIEVVPLKVSLGEHQFRDGIDISKNDFFKLMRESTDYPTTSQPSPEDFLNVFEKYSDDQYSVIYIGVSSALSGTVQSANIAKSMCDNNNIYIVDSMNVTATLGLLVRYACKLRDDGVEPEKIVELLEEKKNKIKIYALVDTLEYLIRGGRVPKVAGKVGGILHVKPMVTLKYGRVKPFDYSRGLARGYAKILDLMDKDDIDTSMPACFANCQSKLNMQELELYVKGKGYNLPWSYCDVGSVIGAHLGPGACAVVYFVK